MKLHKILMAATACAALLSPVGASAEGVKKIGLAVPNLQADFFNQIKLGVENYSKEKGIEVIVVDAKNDTATQVSQVQDLMTQGIDAFIYLPAGAAAAAAGWLVILMPLYFPSLPKLHSKVVTSAPSAGLWP